MMRFYCDNCYDEVGPTEWDECEGLCEGCFNILGGTGDDYLFGFTDDDEDE